MKEANTSPNAPIQYKIGATVIGNTYRISFFYYGPTALGENMPRQRFNENQALSA